MIPHRTNVLRQPRCKPSGQGDADPGSDGGKQTHGGGINAGHHPCFFREAMFDDARQQHIVDGHPDPDQGRSGKDSDDGTAGADHDPTGKNE